MTALAPTAGEPTSPSVDQARSGSGQAVDREWVERHANARIDRRRFEPVWQLAQSFVQNRQWVGWDYHERKIVELPNPDDRERFTVNVLTQYLWTFLGKITADDLRSDIQFRRDDSVSRAIARQALAAFDYAWDEEFDADEKLLECFRSMATMGTSGMIVYPDASYGASIGQYPVGPDGKTHVADAHEFMAGMVEQGEQADLRELREGRLCWRPLTAFNILPPPGVAHERDFPYFIVEEPIALSTLEMWFGKQKTAGIQEESLRAVDLIGVREDITQPGGVQSGMLRGHARLNRGYEMPTLERPEGRLTMWAGNNQLHDGPLPFQHNGQGIAGAAFFKYHPVDGRFWAIGMIEPMIGPQRQRNRARSQWIEMKDRAGLGRVFATKGSVVSSSKPKGGIFELVEVLPGHEFPKETSGTPPGEWLGAEVAQNDGDLDKVAGLQQVSLGQAPAGVSAFAAFALLAEQDDRRVGPVLKLARLQIAKLTKISLIGMRTYWLPGKQVAIAGDDADELVDSFMFDATKIPIDVIIRIGKGAPMPQSQAAETQKMFDIFDRSISSGQVLPLSWLYESLKAGKALPLPKREPQMQYDAAEMENALMAHGQPAEVKPYDNDELHVQRHRIAEQALSFVPELADSVALFEQHIGEHLQSAQQKQVMAMTPTDGGSPPSQPMGVGGQNAGFGRLGAAAQSLNGQTQAPGPQG